MRASPDSDWAHMACACVRAMCRRTVGCRQACEPDSESVNTSLSRVRPRASGCQCHRLALVIARCSVPSAQSKSKSSTGTHKIAQKKPSLQPSPGTGGRVAHEPTARPALTSEPESESEESSTTVPRIRHGPIATPRRTRTRKETARGGIAHVGILFHTCIDNERREKKRGRERERTLGGVAAPGHAAMLYTG